MEATMSGVTLRFYVSEITQRGKGISNATVILLPAYAQGANAEWATATPSGKIELQVSNPAAIEKLDEWRVEGINLHILMQPVNEVEETT
jgi:hypothetical protein